MVFISRTTFFSAVTQFETSDSKISCFTVPERSGSGYMRLRAALGTSIPLYTLGKSCQRNALRVVKKTYRTTPNIRLLDNLNASGSTGSEMRSHSFAMSAVRTDFLGSFLNADFEPRVAASLTEGKRRISILRNEYCHDEPEETETTISSSEELLSKKHGRGEPSGASVKGKRSRSVVKKDEVEDKKRMGRRGEERCAQNTISVRRLDTNTCTIEACQYT